jgi:hypothetical protein
MTDKRETAAQTETREPSELAKETLDDLEPSDAETARLKGGFSVPVRQQAS